MFDKSFRQAQCFSHNKTPQGQCCHLLNGEDLLTCGSCVNKLLEGSKCPWWKCFVSLVKKKNWFRSVICKRSLIWCLTYQTTWLPTNCILVARISCWQKSREISRFSRRSLSTVSSVFFFFSFVLLQKNSVIEFRSKRDFRRKESSLLVLK